MKNDIVKAFDNLTAFHSYLENNEIKEAFKWNESSKSEMASKKKDCKTATYQEADNLLLYGDKNLQKKVEAAGVATTRLKLRETPRGRSFYSAVVGVAPNVGNAIAGVPTAMINVKVRKQPQRVLTVCYTCSAAATVSANDIIKTSAELISALMIIEASGVRVNLYLGEVSEAADQHVAFLVRIKSASQPFDVLKMVYPMAHPSMLRRHMFRALEITDGVNGEFSYGYGRCVPVREHEELFKQTRQKIDVCTDFYQCRYKTAKDIITMLTGNGK